MGKLSVKIHLETRPGEEEMEINACTGSRVQEMMDILYSDIMKRGDTMIIRVTDDDRAYVFYEENSTKKVIPYVKVSHAFSLSRAGGRQALLCALCNATDRIDPNIRGLIEQNPEATRYILEKTAFEVKELNPRDPYVMKVNKLLRFGTDEDVISAIKSITFFVKKIKLVDVEELDELSTLELNSSLELEEGSC